MHNNITNTKLDNDLANDLDSDLDSDNDQGSSVDIITQDDEPENTEAENTESGTIKWFDRKRGFGFIVPNDGEQDILVHSSIIETIGRRDLPEGCNVNYISAQGAKGRHVIEILDVDINDAHNDGWGNIDNANLLPPFDADEEFIIAEIKWFSRVKGYGFLVSEYCDMDIFIHMETIRAAGINIPQDNFTLQVQFEDNGKGPLATAVRLLPEDID